MMKTDKEYELAKAQLAKFEAAYEAQVKELMEKKGLTKKAAQDSLSSSMTYGLQCLEELRLYEKLRKGELPPLEHFSGMGQYLVAARIAKGMMQRELAERLGVKESAVSRDERHEYHGVSMEKAERILKILGCRLDVKELATA
jgi:DNA-binding Xre family transcriptional regulator